MAEKTNIDNNIKISNKSFYYKEQFDNDWSSQPCAYALDLELEKKLGEILKFPLDRIIYASNDFTFRERTKKNDGQLNLPYMNYYRIGYSEPDRPWWNNYANAFGLLDVDNKGYYNYLGSEIRLVPIKVEYESSIFFSQQKDCEYAYSQLLIESSNETIFNPTMTVKKDDSDTEDVDEGVELKNIAIANFDLEFNPIYNESDWLVNNKIWTIALDMSFDTFLVYATNNKINLAKEVIVDFLIAKKLIKPNVYLKDDPKIILEEYFTVN